LFAMKRRWMGLHLAAVAVALVAAAGPGLAFADGEHGRHGERDGYLALGDSLGVGTGVSTPAHLGYVAWVHRAAIPGHTALTNLSRGGETSVTMISNGQLAEAVAAIGGESDVKIVTLDIGGDDLLPLLKSEPCVSDPTGAACQGVIGAQLAGFNASFPTILGTIQAALAADPGDEAFAVMTYYNPFSGTGSPFETPVNGALLGLDGVVDCAAAQANPQNAGLNDLITCTANFFGVPVVDVYPLFAGRGAELTHILENDVHPNNHGHRVIGDAFASVLGLD